MSGEAWSCFRQLPAGLVDPTTRLTLNWLRPRPTLAGFGLSQIDVNEAVHQRVVFVQRAALLALLPCAIAYGLIAYGGGAPDGVSFALPIAGGVMSGAVIIATALVRMRLQRTAPRREAYEAAVLEFAQIDTWRERRCVASFWKRDVDAGEFRQEAAELIAGVFGTGQVTLTWPQNGYGVDMLACASGSRVIAQCKAGAGRIGAEEVRGLAGAKAFFGAEQAIMISREGPTADAEENNRVAERLHISFWNAEALAAWADRLRGSG